jgi:stage V sporulation protein SpoVS
MKVSGKTSVKALAGAIANTLVNSGGRSGVEVVELTAIGAR